MASIRGKGTKRPAKPQHTRNRVLKRKREVEDIESLSERVNDLEIHPTTVWDTFAQLPLSQATQSGLESSHFKKLTPIQTQGIPVSLKGNDVLGSAKTGSGKTLAFLVPVLENLYRKRWTEHDGLGALILSPTRELAIQIFDVLRKVGRNHTFSAGLVIGGKSLQEERERLGRMNILVATPGRVLQHMDQNAELDVGNLQMLVLDEADRIMDMGFQSTVDAIVEHLPAHRQTLLFSATQTKKVSDLARLSLKDPEFVSVGSESDTATPSQLAQNYVVTPLPQKLDTLWSFLRSNTKKKILVFLSSGKQVRFVYEAFRHLQPGLPLLHLHGRQKQSARLDITTKFSSSKHACLFSTDVAARGLDFPAVDWVVQVDCPEDADTYIHRVGRTARYNSSGHAVMFLDPSEEQGMLDLLTRKRVTDVEEIRVREKKMQNTIQNQLQNMCFKDPELKYLGQKAFVSYVRSLFVRKDKTTFDVKLLDLEAFAASLGLPGAPRVKFIKGDDVKRVKNMPRALAAMEKDVSSESDDDKDENDDVDGATKKGKQEKEKRVRTKYDRMFERRNQDVLAEHYAKLIDDGEVVDNIDTADADEDDGFMAVKTRYDVGDERLGRKDLDLQSSSEGEQNEPADNEPAAPGIKKTIRLSTNPDQEPLVIDSNRRAKLLKSKKALLKYKGHGSHLVFDDEDDTGREKVYYEKEDTFNAKGGAAAQREAYLDAERDRAEEADKIDREVARQKRLEKKVKRKEREKGVSAADRDEEGSDDGVELVGGEEVVDVLGDMDFGSGSDNGDTATKSDPKEKRKRKWFEDSESDNEASTKGRGTKRDKKHKHARQYEDPREQPQTLEDLEAMASGLLAR